jgi:trimeric autotransporter adhesin
MVLQSTATGQRWVATSTLGINPFGASVGPTELQATDFGSFTCNGTTCTVDANSLSASMIANGDHGFFSYSSNVASLDANGLTSANLISAVSDETGSGRLVFSNAPAFSGTATFSALTATGTATFATTTQSGRLTLSGSAANIALGSNWLSGDGGDEGIFVTSAGRVGIGTTTPADDIELVAPTYPFLQITETSGTSNAGISLYNPSTYALLYLNTSGNLSVETGGDAGVDFTLTGTGRLGIGTTTPNQKLSIFNNGADTAIEFSRASGPTEKWTLGVDDSDGGKFKISSSSALGTNDRFVIDGAGYIGIGTTTPSQLLTVAGSARITANLHSNTATIGTTTSYASLTAQASSTVIGSELITNGSFTGSATGWTLGSDASYNSNNVRVSCVSACNDATVSQNISTVAGHTYLIQYDFSGAATSSASVYFTNNSLQGNDSYFAQNQVIFTADYTGTDTLFIDSAYYNAGTLYTIDNVSVREITYTPSINLFARNGTRLMNLGESGTNYASGFNALPSSATGGGSNTAVGINALFSNTTGNQNTAIGYSSLFFNTTGIANTALGIGSLLSNTTGNANVAIGTDTLNYNTTGSNNTALGSYALSDNLTGTGNTGLGRNALLLNITGRNNAAVGMSALQNNTTGSNNVSLGYRAGYANTTGYGNIYLGSKDNTTTTGGNITTGFNNIMIGNNTLGTSTNTSNFLNIGNFLFANIPATTSANTLSSVNMSSSRFGIATSTPSRTLTVAGTMRLTGALYDSNNSAGTLGMVLQSTATGQRWVATSTLGLTGLTSAAIDTSAELAAIVGDETGSGRLVFSNAPAFSGTATFSALTATSTLIGQTTIQANTGFIPDADGGAYLGQGTQAFSGLFLDTGSTINFDNSNVVLTHSSGILTMGTGDLRVTTAGTNSASVVTVGGTQTLTSKTLTAPAISAATLSGITTFSGQTASRGLFLDASSRATTTALSAALLNSLTDETGTGVAVFGTAPTFTTSIRVNGIATTTDLTVTNMTSALLLTGANGRLAEYTGTTCASGAVRSISALGVATCGGSIISTSTALAANQIVYGTAAGTIGSEAAFLYNPTTNIFSADTVIANTGFFADTSDGATLGSSTRQFSDLYLASGALIDFAGGNSVITHSSGVLTVSTGDLRVTTAGTNSASVVTVGGTQTLTSKTLTAPAISAATLSGITTFSGQTASRGLFLDASSRATTTAASSLLASSLTDETGSGRLVFSNAPAFSGTATFSSLTATGTGSLATTTQSGRLTLSGSAANIALGSNWLSGDGGDEGVFVTSTGNVGIGTTTPRAKLSVAQTATYGSELVTNGTFTGSATGWTLQSGCSDYSSNTVIVLYDAGCQAGADTAELSTTFSVVTGTTYILTFDIVTNNDTAILWLDNQPSGEYGPYGTGSHSLVFTSIYTGTETVTFSSNFYTTDTGFTIDNVSIRSMDNRSATFALLSPTGATTTVLNMNASHIAIGQEALRGVNPNMPNNLVGIGFAAGKGATNSYTSNFIGQAAGYEATYTYQSNFIGFGAGLKASLTYASNFIGHLAGQNATNAYLSNFMGRYAGSNASNAYQANFFGGNAGYQATNAYHSNFLGLFAGQWATNASKANFMGHRSGYNATNASSSIFIGRSAGEGATNAANALFLGNYAGYNDTVNNTLTNSSIAIGRYAGTGGFSNSIALGRGVINSSSTQLNIGNLLYGTNIYNSDTQSAAAVSAGRIGIGTSTPSQRLSVAGNLRLTGALYDSNNSAGTLGMVLQSTATGQRWVATSSLGISGGSSLLTDGGANTYLTSLTDNLLIGTTTNTANTHKLVVRATDYQLALVNASSNRWGLSTWDGTNGLYFQYNGTNRMFLTSAGNLGIGTTTVNQALSIFRNGADAGIEFSTVSGANEKWTIGIDDSDGTKFKISSSSALGTNDRFVINGAGNIGIGSSSPQSLLTLDRSTGLTGGVVAGLKEYFRFSNATLDAVNYGNNMQMFNTGTATTTLVGQMLRIQDSSQLGNTVRGLEVQAHRGTTTKGENTGISAFGRTFGLRGTTEGDAGGVFQPAGVFAQTRGTTQGNAIRAYSASITSEDLVSLFQDTSAFVGTGLVMNFGNSGGSFSSSTASKFVDFQNAGTSKFIVGNHGMTTIGDGTTSNNAGLQIGYGGICVDNDGTCTASTTGKITSMSSAVGHSDLAEMYFSSESLEPGEIVYSKGALAIGKADEDTKGLILGVVSTNPGLTMGFDDKSLIGGQQGYPIALSGRVPIKLSTENGPIKTGDKIALSSIPGVGMKATEADTVVGTALEDFDGEYAYSEGFVIQFGDNVAQPDNTPDSVEDDKRINDGCYFGGGSELGTKPCKPRDVKRFSNIAQKTIDQSAPMREALLEMADDEPEEMTTPDGKEVMVGQALLFVDLSPFQTLAQTDILNELTSTSTDLVLGGNGEETLWSRIKTLAQGFVEGVLSVTGLRAENVYVENELCVDGVCVTADDLRALLQQANQPQNGSGNEGGEGEPQESTPPPPQEEETGEGNGMEDLPPEDTGESQEINEENEPPQEEIVEEKGEEPQEQEETMVEPIQEEPEQEPII